MSVKCTLLCFKRKKTLTISHRDFDSKPLMGRPFEEHRYEILNHYEWSLLERDLIYISKLYEAYKVFCLIQRAHTVFGQIIIT